MINILVTLQGGEPVKHGDIETAMGDCIHKITELEEIINDAKNQIDSLYDTEQQLREAFNSMGSCGECGTAIPLNNEFGGEYCSAKCLF